jgi:FkbM family methyltransferase
VLEGGPYIGYLTLHAARAVGDQGHVIAVEASPTTAATLRANLVRNAFEQRVRVVEAALGADRGRAPFHLTAGGDTSSLHTPLHPTETVEVDVVPGDALVDAVDVVKLDLEGNELAALKGLRGVIARSRPVIFCECNPEMLRAAQSSPAQLRDELERHGYTVQWIDEDRKALRPFDEPWEAGYVNLRCLPGCCLPGSV